MAYDSEIFKLEGGELLSAATLNACGFHKYLAEQGVRNAKRDWLIFRFGGFVGPGLRTGAIFNILRGSPLFLDRAAELHRDKPPV